MNILEGGCKHYNGSVVGSWTPQLSLIGRYRSQLWYHWFRLPACRQSSFSARHSRASRVLPRMVSRLSKTPGRGAMMGGKGTRFSPPWLLGVGLTPFFSPSRKSLLMRHFLRPKRICLKMNVYSVKQIAYRLNLKDPDPTSRPSATPTRKLTILSISWLFLCIHIIQ